jgi:hypothetical protein
MFEVFPDDTLFEVLLMSCNIAEEATIALVRFVPHGSCPTDEPCNLPPIPVSATWYSHLMPVSIFMDIPNDASSIAPPAGRPVLPIDSVDATATARRGRDLASRWRDNKRPVVATIEFLVDTDAIVPVHLLNFALDAEEALRSRRFTRTSREAIATFCELMAYVLELSADSAE